MSEFYKYGCLLLCLTAVVLFTPKLSLANELDSLTRASDSAQVTLKKAVKEKSAGKLVSLLTDDATNSANATRYNLRAFPGISQNW